MIKTENCEMTVSILAMPDSCECNKNCDAKREKIIQGD